MLSELCGVTGALSVQKQLAPLHTQKRGSGGLARAAEAAPARGWGTGVAGLCSLISQSTNRPACAEWLHNGLGPEHLLSWHKPMTIQGPAPSHHARADIPLNLLICSDPIPAHCRLSPGRQRYPRSHEKATGETHEGAVTASRRGCFQGQPPRLGYTLGTSWPHQACRHHARARWW